MERYLIAVLAALLIVSVGGFLVYVPMVPMISAMLILLGLGLMFLLGMYVGVRCSPANAEEQTEPAKPRRTHLPQYAAR